MGEKVVLGDGTSVSKLAYERTYQKLRVLQQNPADFTVVAVNIRLRDAGVLESLALDLFREYGFIKRKALRKEMERVILDSIGVEEDHYILLEPRR